MVSDRIFSWLSTIPIDARHFTVAAPDDNDQSLPRKRRRFEPPTPDPSDGAMSRPGSPTKRPIDSSNNDDLTPKPLRNKKAKSTPRSESSCSLPASQSQYYASTRSGQSSPLRHLNALEHDEYGLKPRELSTFHPQPPSLEALLDRIDGPAYANEILPSSSRTTFEMLDGDQYWDMKWARQGPRSDKHYSPHRETLGHVPSPDAVQKIVAKAAECSANGHPEVNWNIDVHSRVLEMAFESGNGVAGLISSMGSSTASIIQEYHRTTSRSKKVDFCIYIEPTKDPSYTGIEADIERLSDTLACSVINHTDFYPLRSRPIALSIETKKPGDSWEKAKLQMGIWESARWAFLRQLLGRYTSYKSQVVALDENQHACPVQADLSQLPEFLPGIIVQGHDWNLVITTQEGERTVLWQRVPMGTTLTTKGVYQIICCLQLLRQWVQDSFWPWLRDLIRQSSCCQGFHSDKIVVNTV